MYVQNNRHNLIAKQTTFDNFLVHMQFFRACDLPQNENVYCSDDDVAGDCQPVEKKLQLPRKQHNYFISFNFL